MVGAKKADVKMIKRKDNEILIKLKNPSKVTVDNLAY